jgi:Domain of unknown function (DUF1992)
VLGVGVGVRFQGSEQAMSFEKIVEEQIRKAIADGEFENLRGKGKALELESYFQTPEPLRMAYSMLKSAEFVPEEVRLMQEIDAAKQELSSCADAKRACQLEREIQEKQLSLSVLLERQQLRKK